MKKLMILALLATIPALFNTGCVSTDAYKGVVEDNDRLNKEKEALQSENERLGDSVSKLRDENDGLRNKISEMNAVEKPTINEEELYKKLRDTWDKAGGGDWDVIRRGGAMGVRIDDRNVLFKSGSWELTDKTKETLTKLAALLEKKMDGTTFIRVDGHTDSDPVVKARAHGILDNVHLSAMRAMAVRNFLVSKGLESNRIFVAGFGEHAPLTSNANAKGKQGNRRVEVFIGTADGLSIGEMKATASKDAGKDDQASKDGKGKEVVKGK